MRKVAAFVMALMMLLTITATARSEGSVLDKLSPAEDYEYESEMIIPAALKSTVGYIESWWTANIQYRPMSIDTMGVYQYAFVKAEEFYATEGGDVDQFLEDLRNEVFFNFVSYGDYVLKPVATGAGGSGVIISEDGYMATNHHVIHQNEDELKNSYIAYGLNDEVMQVANEVNQAIDDAMNLAVSGSSQNAEQKEEVKQAIINLYLDQDFTITDEKQEITVYFPDTEGDTAKEKAIVYENVELVAEGDHSERNGKDAAILKLKGKNFPALTLHDGYPNEGAALTAAGFPAASSFLFEGSADALGVTLSEGSVSRIVAVDGTPYSYIQMTNKIGHGNSGGPSVNNKLIIEGLNTLTYKGAQDNDSVNYMVSSSYVLDLTNDIDLKHDKATKLLLLGLQALQDDYGATAKQCFTELKNLNKDVPCIDELIKKAEAAPQNKMKGKSSLNPMLLIIIGIVVGVLVIAGIIVLIILKGKSKKNKKSSAANWNAPLSGNSWPTPGADNQQMDPWSSYGNSNDSWNNGSDNDQWNNSGNNNSGNNNSGGWL